MIGSFTMDGKGSCVLDNNIIQVFRPLIINGLSNFGITADLKQNFQPTKQGANILATVYFFKIGDKRVGSVNRDSYWDVDLEKMFYTEEQVYETTFQINALVKQSPSVIGLTASDVVNYVSSILQSRNTIDVLAGSSLSIYRISDIRNPYFLADDNNYEANPSFDFILQHNQTITSEVPIISTFESNIKQY